MFGCRDDEARGGILHVDKQLLLIGGDSHFVYLGACRLEGSELSGWLEITRHGRDKDCTTIFGTVESAYNVRFTAEVIGAGHFEGRLLRDGYPDARLTMRKVKAQTALI